MNAGENKITFRAMLLGTVFAAVFAVFTVFLENRRGMIPTANQLPLFPYVLLLLSVLLINPLCKLLRVARRLSQTEILIIFIMGSVSSGISTFGLTSQLVPVIGSLFNGEWNNDQTEWNRYVAPFLNDDFFLAEAGIQAAAAEYRKALIHEQELQRAYDADAGKRQPRGATRTGTKLAYAAYPELMEKQRRIVAEKRLALRQLEAKAFEKVENFRRGLPDGLRAFPGFMPVIPQDDIHTYLRRLRRLSHGKRAARYVNAALNILGSDPGTHNQAASREISDLIGLAVRSLSPIGPDNALEDDKKSLNECEFALAGQLADVDAQLVSLNAQKRKSSVEEARETGKTIRHLGRRRKAFADEREDVLVRLERNRAEKDIAARVAGAVADLTALRENMRGSAPSPHDEAKKRLTAVLVTFPSFDASLRRYFLGDVPWSHWIKPLLNWAMLICLTYVILMTFNVLIFRQWAHNEKLIYPLAELPEILAGTDTAENGMIPQVFRSGLFWAGFAVSASVLGWNLLCASGVAPGLNAFDLNNKWHPYISDSILAGLTSSSGGGGARSAIFFTMIGLAFLIPKKVSFSLWFFWILYMSQILIIVWMGYGQNEASFPTEWWYTLNFRTAEGGGALLVFASVALFKCRKYLLCAFSPSSVNGLPPDEQRELRISSALFLMGTLGLLFALCRGMGIHVVHAVFAYIVILVITIGLIRAVTEGGILGFQAWVSPFHAIRHIFGFDKPWTAPHFFAPLMTYYSILFLDIKAFIAPAMANGLKIRDDLKMSRGKFHAAMALCIVTAAVSGVLAAIMMSYESGGDSMHGWFYNHFPSLLFKQLAEMSKTPPAATPSDRLWLCFGALAMAALLFFRQRLFWLPHPIGFIMLVNPIMQTFWFSIFLGWLAKSLVTKYGNKDTYGRVRGMFIGLIVGELAVVTLAMIVSLALQKNLGIDLNRN